MKKLIIAAGIVIGIVVILAALPFVIDLNKHKGAILQGMKTVTQRRVDFEGIRLTILSGLGVEIRGLRIADDPAFSKESFLTLKAARVKVGLVPLLRKEIVVHEIVLDEPRVHLVRDKGGKLNTSTLLLPKPEEPREKSAVELRVNRVEIQGGSLSYRDDKLKPGAEPFVASDIGLETRGLSLSEPIPFTLAASVTGGKGRNMNVTGTIGPMPEGAGFGQAPLDVHMTIDSLALAALPVKVPVSSGSMKADITLKGTLKDRIESKVALDLAGIVPTGPKPAGKVPGISCSLKSDMVLELAREQLSIRGGTFALGQDTGTFEGTVTGLKKAPAWDITVRSDRITPAAILEQLPGLAAKIPPKLSLKGPASFTLVTTGSRAGFDLKTRVDMRPTAVAFGTLFDKPAGSPFVFTSTIRKNPEVTEIAGLDFDLGPIQARGSGEVRKMGETSRFQVHIDTRPVPLQTAQSLIPMLRKFQPTGNMTVKTLVNGGSGSPMAINVHAVSERMGLVLARPREGAAPRSTVMAGPSRADMKQVTLTVDAMKKDKALNAQGALKSQGGTFMNVPYATLTSAFRLAGDRLNVTSFDLAALKGSIRGSASYDLKSKAWEASPVFNNVQAGSILDTLTSFKGVFTGTVTGDLRVKGVAGAPALNSLGAKGNLSISRGEWRNFDLAGTVLSSVLGVPGASEIFGFAPAEVQRYDTTRFESLNTSIDLSKKVINVDTMKLLNITSGRDVDTESSLKGTISMETNEVNLKGNVVLPKRFSQRVGAKAEAFSAIMNEQKRLVLPVSITGSTKKPVPMVQVGALSSAFTKYYATKALDRGMQKLKDKGRLPAGSEETRRAVDNVLEGLLRKKKQEDR